MLAAPDIRPPLGDWPVVLSIPHAGRDYPPALLALSAGGRAALATLEDPLVDRLAWRALADGFGAVIARAPRAAIDCNRALDEVEGGSPSPRLAAGLGLVPSRTQRHGQLWRTPPDAKDIAERVARAYHPYHEGVAALIDRAASRHGAALLLDLHSMPPRRGQADIVLGDRHGRSADPWITAEAARHLRGQGFTVALNEPFAGGEIVARHGRPGAAIHAVQVEIGRALYLDAALTRPGPGFDRLAQAIAGLATAMAAAVGALPLAAE